MFALIKLGVLPTASGWGILATAVPSAGTIGALIAIASLVGGALVVGTLRAQLSAAKGTITLGKDEREILAAKAERLEKRNTILEAQPNLDKHARLLEELTSLVIEQGHLMREQSHVLHVVQDAVVPPDRRDPLDR